MSLILVMLALLILSVLAAGIVFTARSETLASYNWKLDTQADYLAKAGIQYGVNWLRSSRYQSIPIVGGTYTPSQVYVATISSGIYDTYTSDSSPVLCRGTGGTNCPTNKIVQFISIPNSVNPDGSTAATTYPTGAVSSPVVTNYNADFPSTGLRITGSSLDSGVVYVNMVLMNFSSVEQGTPPLISPFALETWKVTSRAYWTGSSTGSSTNAVAMAEEESIIQPIYIPNWAYAMYGYCSVSMSGSAGVCTDAFNSALGAYAMGVNATASSGCDSATASNVIDAGAGVGANGYVSLGSNVSVAGNVTIGSSPAGGSACCSGSSCGFQGNLGSVAGQVVSGPNIPPPSTPTFPSNLSTAPDPGSGTVTYAMSCEGPTLAASLIGGSFATGSYYYTVTALGSWGESAQAEAPVFVTGPNGSVTVTWLPVTGATSYHVYRGTSSRTENTYFVPSPPTATAFVDTGAAGTPGSPPGGIAQYPTYNVIPAPSLGAVGGGTLNSPEYYVVTALGTWGETAGTEAGVTFSGNKQVKVNWNAVTGATGYKIYRGTASGGETGYISAGPCVTPCSYNDGGAALTAGTPPTNPWTKFSSGTGANPPFFGCSGPCGLAGTCDGTVNNPFELNQISMSNGDVLQLIGGRDIFHPVSYDVADFQETGGSIMVSGYIVLNIKNSLKIAGNGLANPLDYQALYGVAVNVPPECVQMNYAGTNTAQIQGNGAVSAVILAPNATVQLGGGGSGGYMIGAIQAQSTSMQGGYPLHYDIQLSKAGGIIGVMTTTAYTRKRM